MAGSAFMVLLTDVCRLNVVRTVVALPFCAIAAVVAIIVKIVMRRFKSLLYSDE